MITEWVNLLSKDPVTIVVVIILVLLGGGIGATLISSIAANRRGIRGDALVKEANGIDGLDKLTKAQGAYIENLEKRQTEIENDLKEAKLEAATARQEAALTRKDAQETRDRLEALEEKLEAEIRFSNAQIELLVKNGIAPVPRPV